MTRIIGPIISVGDMAPYRQLFVQGFGMVEEAHDRLQVDGVALESCFLRTPGTAFGVRMWRCDPPTGAILRDPARGTDTDAPKVIDFYAPDFDTALARLARAGFSPKAEIARYSTADGDFQEAHFWQPDGIVCAIISGTRSYLKDFATIIDSDFSEPHSISTPVGDAARAIAFYRQVFGFSPVSTYAFADSSFDAMVGSTQTININAVNVGVANSEPYLGIIDYGLKGRSGQSLNGRARPPARGLLGAEITTLDVDALAHKAAANGAQILAGPTDITLAPYGATRSVVLLAPHGVLHHVLEAGQPYPK